MRSSLVLVVNLLMTACGGPAVPEDATVLGQWEKDDQRLPPISLLLTSAGGETEARLRLSGSEWHGTATVDGDRVTLKFSNRPEVTGRLVSSNELVLRFDSNGREYTLTRR